VGLCSTARTVALSTLAIVAVHHWPGDDPLGLGDGTMTLNRSIALLVAGSLALTLGACSTAGSNSTAQQSPTRARFQAATKVYTDVDALGKDSDLIVRGTVSELSGTALDDGGLGPGHGGIPVAFYTVSVESHAGIGQVPASVTLGYIDTAKVQGPDVEPLAIGQEYVFFLVKRTPDTAPGVAEWTPFYVPTSGSFGVFTVGSDGIAVAHKGELVRLDAGGAAAGRVNGRLAVPASDLLAAR